MKNLDEIKAQIKTYEAELHDYVESVNLEIAFRRGRIQALEELLNSHQPPAEVKPVELVSSEKES